MSMQASREAVEAAKVELYNRVWTDEAFAARLESDPKAVFAEMGGQIPDEVEIRVVRDTDTVKHLHIPAAPSEGEISDGDLAGAHGGITWVSIATVIITATLAPPAGALTFAISVNTTK